MPAVPAVRTVHRGLPERLRARAGPAPSGAHDPLAGRREAARLRGRLALQRVPGLHGGLPDGSRRGRDDGRDPRAADGVRRRALPRAQGGRDRDQAAVAQGQDRQHALRHGDGLARFHPERPDRDRGDGNQDVDREGAPQTASQRRGHGAQAFLRRLLVAAGQGSVSRHRSCRARSRLSARRAGRRRLLRARLAREGAVKVRERRLRLHRLPGLRLQPAGSRDRERACLAGARRARRLARVSS